MITVPSPLVDRILDVMTALGLSKGMSLEEHFGFEPSEVKPLFLGCGFELLFHKRFQLGLNNLFVFVKP